MSSRGKVLVTGAGGFIGRGLVTELLRRKVLLRTLFRHSVPETDSHTETIIGDLLQPESLPPALEGIDTAYYLVHSLAAGRDQFRNLDRQAAENFVAAARATNLRRVIYLSGLGRQQESLSEHLGSRDEVAEILAAGPFQTTTLRAAIILGAGGASFELLRYLVKTQLLLPDSPQLETRCQPVALADVLDYLAGCLEDERTTGETYDIGGPEILSYRELLERIAEIAGAVNLFVPAGGIPAGLVGRWVGLLSRQKSTVVAALLEGLNNEVICEEQRIRQLIKLRPTPLDQAIRQALKERS